MPSALRLLLLLACAAVASGAARAQLQLVWQDDFDGTALDSTKWGPMVGTGCPNLCGWGNNELQYYRAANATVSNGTLKITARRESFGGAAFTSARLRTLNRADFKYGRFEVRAKLPAGRGLWPAFWMLPSDNAYGGWAASGEIDVMEFIGHETSTVHGTLHFGGGWPANTSSGASFTLPGGDFSDDFHVFALEWEPAEMRWYVDGQLYSVKTSWWSAGGPFPAPFDQRFHLLLNLAVGGDWPGPPSASTPFPATFEVDYVRVYQDTASGPSACAQVFDDVELTTPADYFTFDGPTASGQLAVVSGNHPPVPGATSLRASWADASGAPGYLGGFGRTRPLDLSAATHLEFWIDPDANQDLVVEINLQDDDDGDGSIPSVPDGNDDEFQYELRVAPSQGEVVSGGGWQKVSIPLSAFTDDDSFHFGGNGVWDPTPSSAGGNGQLVNVVFALVSIDGRPADFTLDQVEFTRRGSISGRVWADENRDGNDLLELGLPGVRVELREALGGALLEAVPTDVNGYYAFDGLGAGEYTTAVDPSTLPYASTPTHDPDGTATPHAFTASLPCGEHLGGRSFGYDSDYLGATYCSPANSNSTGLPGEIYATGSPLAADNDLVVYCSSLPPNQFGYFLVSDTRGFLPMPAGSQGNLCLLGDVGRYVGPNQVQASGPLGLASLVVDLTQVPRPTGAVSTHPGDTLYFQFWHRDAAPSGPGSNMTDAVGIVFQ